MICVDTSFLMRLFLDEPGSALARDWVSERRSVIALSSFNLLEFENALSLKRFRGELDEADVALIRQKLNKFRRSGLFQHITESPEVWEEASLCAVSHTPSLGTRSLDIVQVAFAVVQEVTEFGSFDLRQRQLAEICGLKVNPMP